MVGQTSPSDQSALLSYDFFNSAESGWKTLHHIPARLAVLRPFQGNERRPLLHAVLYRNNLGTEASPYNHVHMSEHVLPIRQGGLCGLVRILSVGACVGMNLFSFIIYTPGTVSASALHGHTP